MSLLGTAWKTLSRALGSLTQGASTQKSPPFKGSDPRVFLSGAAPGLWASNHLNEAMRCEGWQFVAVRSLARMCSQASVQVYEVGSVREQAKRLRHALRWAELRGESREAKTLARRLERLRSKSYRKRLKAQGIDPSRRPAQAGDPLLAFLKRPNPEWSLQTFLFAGVQQLALTGSCLLWRVNHMGYPAECYVLPTGLCQVRMPTPAYPLGSYYLTPLSSFGLQAPAGDFSDGPLGHALLTGCEIDARDVKPVRWPHPVYLSDGLSPLFAVRLWVDVSNQMDLATWAALLNAERPGLIIEQDPSIDPDAKDLAQFDEWMRVQAQGAMNARRNFRLPKGLRVTDQNGTVSDLDFPTGRPSARDQNLVAHGLGAVTCGVAEAGSYSMLWAATQQANEQTVQPTLGLFAGELTEFFGSDFDGPQREIEFKPKAVNDPQLHHQKQQRAYQAGNAVTVNEWRAADGYPPLKKELGDQFVGMKVSATAKDTDDKPGVQPEGDQTDGSGNERESGIRDEGKDKPDGRDAPGAPGKGADKHLTNGHVGEHATRW